ncbi:MAG: PQQ-dependent sugar dehydrogenase [Ilumatobacteraceae bacterium]
MATFGLALSACSNSEDSAPTNSPVVTASPDVTGTPTNSEPAGDPFLSATLGEPMDGFDAPVDLAVRPGEPPLAYVVEQGGTIREMLADGAPGRLLADLSESTRANGEQGLLGLVFDATGDRAFVNYTDRQGDTTVERFTVADDGTFDISSRRVIYTLAQPYANHNGGELLLAPDGVSLLVFTGDGGSANDPERHALDPQSELGKIVRLDISQDDPLPEIWASGLRNPWRAAYDAETDDLWVADVGQNLWEEINVVPLAEVRGTSFGWSALEGTAPFNDDQAPAHAAAVAVDPIHTYPHDDEDCSISGGFVYRGDGIPHVGTWYLFADFCSGRIQALCVDTDKKVCGVTTLGTAPKPVGILPDGLGLPWILSLDGQLIPIVSAA